MLVVVLMILVYLRCEHGDERMRECAKTNRTRRDCVCMFQPDYACPEEAKRSGP